MKKLIFIFLILHLSFNVEDCICQWVQKSNGIGNNENVFALQKSGNKIYAATGTETYPPDTGRVWLSTNNGENWQNICNGLGNPPTNLVTSLLVMDTLIFAGTNGKGVFLSTNNGNNWITVNNGLTYPYVLSLVSLGNNIFAGTNGNGVFLSTNNGASWTLASNGLPNHFVYTLAVTGNYLFAGIPSHGAFKTTNNGLNWTGANNGLTYPYVYYITTSGSNVYAGIAAHGLYLSTNYGTNWNVTGLSFFTVCSIAVMGVNIFAGTYDYLTSTGIFMSTNNGINWVGKNHGFNVIPHVLSLLIVNNYIYAGTYEQSVWRREISEITGIKNISTGPLERFEIGQNYPNPFNPVTKIKFGIPESDFVELEIYDILGKLVQVLVNKKLSAGEYEYEWNGSAHSSGIYFYKFRAGDYVQTRKMVLLR